jgi:hypothetical protein
MLEALFVVALVAVLVLLGLAALFLSVEAIVVVGLVCIAAGFGIGLPAGIYYHVKLYRLLAARAPVPLRFWWQPTRFHELLEPAQWRGVLPWFVIGGTGFLLTVLGCVVVLVGVLKG